MVRKDIQDYVDNLKGKGYTNDAIRRMLLNQGIQIEEIRKALSKKVKNKSSRIFYLLIIAVILLVILIPTLILLTTERSTVIEDNNKEITEDIITGDEIPEEENIVEEYECTIDEECSFSEFCFQQQCIELQCSICENTDEHECVPMTCEDDNSCTIDSCSQDMCQNTPITTCTPNDGCCPDTCTYANDADCAAIDECNTNYDCDDEDDLTIDTCEGTPRTCKHIIPTCKNDDYQCPLGCSNLNDNDCNPVCGNNVLEATETCDGDCPLMPEDCNDNEACTTDSLIGSHTLCTAECIYKSISLCESNDNCCPEGCTYSTDNDCDQTSTKEKEGSFTTVLYTTTGTVEVYKYEDASIEIRLLNNFYTTGPTLHPTLKVYLTKESIVETYSDIEQEYEELGELSAMSGLQNYYSNVNLNEYHAVAIYSSQYNAVYGYVTIN